MKIIPEAGDQTFSTDDPGHAAKSSPRTGPSYQLSIKIKKPDFEKLTARARALGVTHHHLARSFITHCLDQSD